MNDVKSRPSPFFHLHQNTGKKKVKFEEMFLFVCESTPYKV